jgi:hypothetical protein
MRRRYPRWVKVLLCAAAGLLLAVTVLGGAAQAVVGAVSVFAMLFAVVRGLDSPDVQGYERHVTRDEVGSGGYHSGMGSMLHTPSPVGPVNTPAQDRVDALERAWRAPSPEDR